MSDFKYQAFISYSHRDDKWASWLHRAIESYRPPKVLVGQAGLHGREIPARLSPVFRDREELPTATDLGVLLSGALEESACQIVICSPAGASSHWVNEEILAFKRLGREDRIFCLIVDGEPHASADSERAHEECFPPALRYKLGPDGNLGEEPTEPIAADAREGKDGRQNAKLKLVAGMLGVGFDALKQREHHRRQRRLIALASAATVGMIVMTGLATAALFARAEAERQRERAEAEAETAQQTANFMVELFRVSDPGEARGNTITAREILDRGADRIATELADEPVVQATLMDTVGTVYMSLGLYNEAKPLLEDALRRRIDVLGQENSVTAETQANLGELSRLRAEFDESEQYFLDALAVRRAEFGATSDVVASTLVGLAELYSEQGRYEPAETALREALDIRRRLLGDEHEEVAEAMEDLGLVLFDQGNLADAKELLESAVEIQRRVWGERPHPALAESLNNLAFIVYEEGDYERVQSLLTESLRLKEQLFDEGHPEIGIALNNLAFVMHDRGQLDDAEATYRQVLAQTAEFVGRIHPDYAITLNNLAYVLYDQGNVEEALKTQFEAAGIYRELFPDGHPELADSLSNIAAWQIELDEVAEAEAAVTEALEMRIAMLGPDHADVGASLLQRALVAVAAEDYDNAERFALQSQAILDEKLPEGHWRRGLIRAVLGAALAGRGEFEAAEPLLLDGYATMTADEGALRVYLRRCLLYLESLYLAWQRPDDAARYRALLTDSYN